jgi:hypothetical protein
VKTGKAKRAGFPLPQLEGDQTSRRRIIEPKHFFLL